ncbi:hypothetical protein [Paraburkholderia aromaticivorans]|uniref:hypothetical protein n=1 Tax=Paraburkholderia aromaticivorans TaxID=2026199 RepID=UPI001455DF63|nr:hypothetical protein [Paraburkholderia aromaticivorans]
MTKANDVKRQWLYDEVWRVPMAEVGENLGISRETVRWACIKLGIPRPPQAYWVHLWKGHPRDPRPSLLPLARGQRSSITRADLLKQERPKRRKNPELEKRRADERRRILDEYLELEQLNQEVDDWHRAELMRGYLAELDRRLSDGGRQGSGYEDWRIRAEAAIVELDKSNLRVKMSKR